MKNCEFGSDITIVQIAAHNAKYKPATVSLLKGKRIDLLLLLKPFKLPYKNIYFTKVNICEEESICQSNSIKTKVEYEHGKKEIR